MTWKATVKDLLFRNYLVVNRDRRYEPREDIEE